MWAADEGQTEAIRELLKAGADINSTDVDGYTALMVAGQGQTEAIRVFMRGRIFQVFKTAFDLWQLLQKTHCFPGNIRLAPSTKT